MVLAEVGYLAERGKIRNIPERKQQLRLGALWLTRETMMRVFHETLNGKAFK